MLIKIFKSILVPIFLSLFICAVSVTAEDSPLPMPSNELLIKGFIPADAASIKIKDKRSALTLFKNDDKWRIKEASGSFADDSMVSALLDSLAKLAVREKRKLSKDDLQFSSSRESIPDYSGISLEILDAENKPLASLFLGEQSFPIVQGMRMDYGAAQSRNIKIASDNDVFFVTDTPFYLARPIIQLWKNHGCPEPENPSLITYSADGSDSWQNSTPSLLKNFTAQLSSIRPIELLPPSEFRKCGLDNPSAVFKVRTSEGFEYTYRIAADDSNIFVKLDVGLACPDSSNPKAWSDLPVGLRNKLDREKLASYWIMKTGETYLNALMKSYNDSIFYWKFFHSEFGMKFLKDSDLETLSRIKIRNREYFINIIKLNGRWCIQEDRNSSADLLLVNDLLNTFATMQIIQKNTLNFSPFSSRPLSLSYKDKKPLVIELYDNRNVQLSAFVLDDSLKLYPPLPRHSVDITLLENPLISYKLDTSLYLPAPSVQNWKKQDFFKLSDIDDIAFKTADGSSWRVSRRGKTFFLADSLKDKECDTALVSVFIDKLEKTNVVSTLSLAEMPEELFEKPEIMIAVRADRNFFYIYRFIRKNGKAYLKFDVTAAPLGPEQLAAAKGKTPIAAQEFDRRALMLSRWIYEVPEDMLSQILKTPSDFEAAKPLQKPIQSKKEKTTRLRID